MSGRSGAGDRKTILAGTVRKAAWRRHALKVSADSETQSEHGDAAGLPYHPGARPRGVDLLQQSQLPSQAPEHPKLQLGEISA